MKNIKHMILIATCITLTACGSSNTNKQGSGLTPMPGVASAQGKVKSPSNATLAGAIQSYLKKTNNPASSGYKLVRVDLNNDRRNDALVMLTTPYGHWCNDNGCAMLVLKANAGGFTLVNKIQPVRGPIDISRQSTKGWKNMIVRVSGRQSKAKNVVLAYNGRAYPQNPERLPRANDYIESGTTRVFHQ